MAPNTGSASPAVTGRWRDRRLRAPRAAAALAIAVALLGSASAFLGTAPAQAAARSARACAACLRLLPAPRGVHPAVAAGATAVYGPGWSGYAQVADALGTYKAVRDYWTVPTVNTSQPGDQYSGDWVGIGGIFPDTTLVQAGTEADNLDGTAYYAAWAEALPAPPVPLGLAIHPGDEIETVVEQTSANTWQMTVDDLTTGQHNGITATGYSSSGLSAEAIHEAPAINGGQSSLAGTSNVTFEPGSYSTAAPGTQSWQPLLTPAGGARLDRIFMLNSSGTAVIASPSATDPNHDGFRVADGSVSPAPPPEAAQLVFDDYIGTVYSIQVDGENQNGQTKDACFTTPKTVDLIPNWWWAAGTKIRAFTSGNCGSGELGIKLYLTDSATVPPYHCQEDVSPYRDWNPGGTWQNCAINPSPNHVWYGDAIGRFIRNM